MSAPRSPAWWVPSLYFSQGIPYVVVMSLSVILYKRLGVANGDISYYTSWLYLPWVVKPLWSPLVDITGTKRRWVVLMQFLVAAGLALVALAVPGAGFFKLTLALFWVMALASATHDIAADGFYMLALPPHEQVWWVGLRSTFYRTAMVLGSGLLVVLAGYMEAGLGRPRAWSLTLFAVAVLFLGFSIWHALVLPRPERDGPVGAGRSLFAEFWRTFGSFFQKPGLGLALAVEQFGYGFGFTAFMLYLLYFAEGAHRTAHYAICTGFMALGMMVPGLWSGRLADYLGYQHFFLWVIGSAVPGFVLALRLKVDPEFGKRT